MQLETTELSALRALTLAHAGDGPEDDRALHGWLTFVSLRNQHTYRSYRKEANRFRVFLATLHRSSEDRPAGTLLRDATEVDVALYEAHLLGKMRDGKSIAPLTVPREILNRYGLADQPFVKSDDAGGISTIQPIRLKPSSANQALAILHALYRHWLQPDPSTRTTYVGANPVRRTKSASNRVQRQTDRNFPLEAVQAMLQATDLVATSARTNTALIAAHLAEQMQAQCARQRWIVSLLFGLWGRRAEIANLRMGNFKHDGIRWTVTLQRKGGHEQVLPVAGWVIAEFARYRQSIGLAALPANSDDAELKDMSAIARLRKRSEPTSSNRPVVQDDGFQFVATGDDDTKPATISVSLVYREVGAVAKLTAELIRRGQLLDELPEQDKLLIASRLDEVSPHWFRHSGATIAINSGIMSLENASKLLGHASTDITAGMYYHPDVEQIETGLQKLGDRALGLA